APRLARFITRPCTGRSIPLACSRSLARRSSVNPSGCEGGRSRGSLAGARSRGRFGRGRFLELLGREVGDGGVDQLAEVAVERGVELMHREADAVIGDAIFLEIVRAN